MVEFTQAKEPGDKEMVGEIKSVHMDNQTDPCVLTGKVSKSKQLHFVIKPSQPASWKEQNWWLGDSMSLGTAWYDAVKQFKKLGIITDDSISSAQNNLGLAQMILQNSKGKKFKWEERRIGRKEKATWFPIEVV
jgi:hypothetical protein